MRFEPLLTSHLDELATVLLHPAVYEHIEASLPSVSDFKLGLERALGGPSSVHSDERWLNYLVRSTSGRMIGRLEATVHHGVAEVAFLFSPASWGRGLATKSLLWLHEELLRSEQVAESWATTVEANVRSQRLLLRCGYVRAEPPLPHPLYSYDAGDLVFCRCGMA
ncbi:MAG: GNAT family N-acetyltransferase [Acidobacteriota bacterium]